MKKALFDLSYAPYGERSRFDLYLPEDSAQPAPLVLAVHGGGWRGGSRGRFRWMAEGLTHLGFALALPTYRFWPEWRCPAPMEDIQRVIRLLRRRAPEYGLDPDRFAGIGSSAGGHLVSYAALADAHDDSDPDLARFSTRLQCVIDCCGPVDLPAMMASASAPIVEGFMGQSFAEAEEDYRHASPHHLVAAAPPPFLIIHGVLDTGVASGQVPLTQAERFAERLAEAGGDVTLLRLPDAGHGFVGNVAHRPALWTAAARFLRQHLRPRPARA